jgi:hypothetical protein
MIIIFRTVEILEVCIIFLDEGNFMFVWLSLYRVIFVLRCKFLLFIAVRLRFYCYECL